MVFTGLAPRPLSSTRPLQHASRVPHRRSLLRRHLLLVPLPHSPVELPQSHSIGATLRRQRGRHTASPCRNTTPHPARPTRPVWGGATTTTTTLLLRHWSSWGAQAGGVHLALGGGCALFAVLSPKLTIPSGGLPHLRTPAPQKGVLPLPAACVGRRRHGTHGSPHCRRHPWRSIQRTAPPRRGRHAPYGVVRVMMVVMRMRAAAPQLCRCPPRC